MNISSPSENILAAVAACDLGRAWLACLEDLRSNRSPAGQVLALLVLRARSREVPAAEGGRFVQKALSELRALDACDAPEALLVAGELLHAAGLRQEAGIHWHRAMQDSGLAPTAAKALGLLEMERAFKTPLDRNRELVARWRASWCYLSMALNDGDWFPRWATARCQVYSVPCRERVMASSRGIILRRFHDLMTAHAEAARNRGYADVAAMLRSLADECRCDQAGVEAFAAALIHCPRPLPSNRPLPFGLMWHREAGSALDAAALQETVAHTVSVPREDVEDASARTYGIYLRQWYSRLAPVRFALSAGQFSAALSALEKVCSRDEGCQPNRCPIISKRFDAPRTCDPDCESFAHCNPGYAGSGDGPRQMESDAHRLGVMIRLSLADQQLRRAKPRPMEAAGHWVVGRSLAESIGERDQYVEAVTHNVLDVVQSLRDAHDMNTEILRAAMGAVPTTALRGRLCDQLTDRGIDACNGERWSEALHDLRLAWRLNQTSERIFESLAIVLQKKALAYEQRAAYADAAAMAEELLEICQIGPPNPNMKSLLEQASAWAREHAAHWHHLANVVQQVHVMGGPPGNLSQGARS